VPAEFRTALVLFDIEGRTYDEVAAIENVPVGTVKSRLSRGRTQLRRLLGEAEDAGASPAGVARREGLEAGASNEGSETPAEPGTTAVLPSSNFTRRGS